MRKIAFIILTIISVTTVAQRIKKKDIEFSSIEEVEQAVVYLNKCRTIPGYASESTGIYLHHSIVRTNLVLDSNLYELAKRRVVEMIKNQKLSHITKIKEVKSYHGECISGSNNFNQAHSELFSTIDLYIIDKGVKSKGHRLSLLYDKGFTKIGYAGAYYKGQFWTCVLLS